MFYSRRWLLYLSCSGGSLAVKFGSTDLIRMQQVDDHIRYALPLASQILRQLSFSGLCEYFENFAHIDTTFLNRFIFDFLSILSAQKFLAPLSSR